MSVVVERRRRYFVDSQVQLGLLQQAVLYWFWGSATFGLIILVNRLVPPLLSGGSLELGGIWHDLGPLVFASVVLFPIAIFGAVRFSNRFVGPMFRFRKTLKQLARGEQPSAIALRKDDFWSDVADDINDIAERLSQVAPAATSDATSDGDSNSQPPAIAETVAVCDAEADPD